jgi:hypothetical protein
MFCSFAGWALPTTRISDDFYVLNNCADLLSDQLIELVKAYFLEGRLNCSEEILLSGLAGMIDYKYYED